MVHPDWACCLLAFHFEVDTGEVDIGKVDAGDPDKPGVQPGHDILDPVEEVADYSPGLPGTLELPELKQAPLEAVEQPAGAIQLVCQVFLPAECRSNSPVALPRRPLLNLLDWIFHCRQEADNCHKYY